MLLNDVPVENQMGTIVVQSLYGISALLVLNGTLLYSNNALLVLNGTLLNSNNALLVLNGTLLNSNNALLVLNGTLMNSGNAIRGMNNHYTSTHTVSMECPSKNDRIHTLPDTLYQLIPDSLPPPPFPHSYTQQRHSNMLYCPTYSDKRKQVTNHPNLKYWCF